MTPLNAQSDDTITNTKWTELLKNETSSFIDTTDATTTTTTTTTSSNEEKSTETTLERLGFIEEQLVAKNELDLSKRINETVTTAAAAAATAASFTMKKMNAENGPLQGVKQEIQKMMVNSLGREEGEEGGVVGESEQQQQVSSSSSKIANMSTDPNEVSSSSSSTSTTTTTTTTQSPVTLNGITATNSDNDDQGQFMQDIREQRQKAMAQDLATAAYHAELQRKAKRQDKMQNISQDDVSNSSSETQTQQAPTIPNIDVRELIDKEESTINNVQLNDAKVRGCCQIMI